MQKRARMVVTSTMIALVVISQFFFCYGEKAFCATPAEIQEWLDAHNAYRALHGVSPVTWSDTLAARAQAWADACPSGHSSSGYGENMAFATYILAPTEVVALWYSEEALYPYGEPAWNPAWGHFTQVVWKGSTCNVAIKIQTKSCLEGNTFSLWFLVQQGLDESPDLFFLG